MEIIFATKNINKLKEIQEIMSGTQYSIISMKDAGIDIEVEEDGETFEENAIKKAKEIMLVTNKICMADDSGIEIDFLDKKPGVYSARFLGVDTPYSVKNELILEQMKNVPDEKRTARFVCVIATVFPSNETIITKGIIEGVISKEIKGENGFGYDPIFYVPEEKMTTAEMSSEQKNKISHRGKALRQMKNELERLNNIL